MPVQRHSTFFESGGVRIAVDCYLAESEGRRPAVVGLHGSGGNHAAMAETAVPLAEQGASVFVVHYFDRTSTTEAGDKQIIIRNFPVWGKTVWDAVSHVSRHPQVDPERIGLLGFSLGAYLALSVASVDARVKAVVEFYGGLPREMKFFMRRLCPVLILHGEADATVPVAEAYALEKELQRRGLPCEMQIYRGVGHRFEGETWQDAQRRTVAFLAEHLRAGNAPNAELSGSAQRTIEKRDGRS